MLVRTQNGHIFHIVQAQSRTHYLCLCGARIFRNCASKQRMAPDRPYSRCPDCRHLEIERLRKSPHLKVYRR